MNQEQVKFIVDAVKNAYKALDDHSFETAEGLDTPTAMGTARGHLSCIIADLEELLLTHETDATPIDVDTFDGDVFDDKKNAWIVAAAFEMDFEPDWEEVAEDMDSCDFEYIYDEAETGRHVPGTEGWDQCVKDYWNDTMDADDKAHHIIKKDSEGKS